LLRATRHDLKARYCRETPVIARSAATKQSRQTGATQSETGPGAGAEGLRDSRVTPELIERWALDYLGHYASSAGNLRRVLLRRVERRAGRDRAALAEAAAGVDALVLRYREAGLLDDAAYAAGRVQALVRRGEPLMAIGARLRAKGVDAATAAAAIAALRETAAEPDLAAACAFARRRRLGAYRHGAADRPRELAAFARAGFSQRIAERVLACPDVAAIEALARGEDG
jgi:regulatory protein